MVPAHLEPSIYGLPLWPFRPAMARPSQPVADLATRARLSPDFRGPRLLATGDPAPGGGPVLWLECSSEAWSQPRLGLPRLFAQATKPGLPPLPRHVALRLPLLDRWNPQVSEPAMFLGANARW
jgi:hypothetical protein